MWGMSRRVARLTLDNVADLSGRCSTCVFWELDPVRRIRARGHERDEPRPGSRGCCSSGAPAGGWRTSTATRPATSSTRPAVYLPGARRFPTAPVSEDAVLLATAMVVPRVRRRGWAGC